MPGRVRRERASTGRRGRRVAVPELAVASADLGESRALTAWEWSTTRRSSRLWLSPHILVNTGRVLATVLKMPDDEIDEYLRCSAEMAEASGGGITDPPQVVGDCPDWEDNRVLDLAAAVGAFLIVSADADLTTHVAVARPPDHRAIAVRVAGRRFAPRAQEAMSAIPG